MQNPFNANNSLDEVVFANRNKSYGAYAIRRSYNTALTKSIIIVLSAFTLLLLLSFVPPDAPVPAPDFLSNDSIVITEYEIFLPEKQESGSEKSNHTDKKTAVYKIAPGEEIPEPVKPKDPAESGTSDPGNGNDKSGTGNVTGGMGKEGGVTNEGGTGETKLPMITIAEFMPEFNNGSGDLKTYLLDKIDYPDIALSIGRTGKVVIAFTVDTSGLVSDISVIKGIGYGCDEEAARVVREMPKWKPGMQNGKKVPVRMVLPILFELE